MTCNNNYIIQPMQERRRMALRSLRDASVPRPLALALVTLSEGESGVIWASPRPNLRVKDDFLDCCSIIIGVETAGYPQLPKRSTQFTQWLGEQGYASMTGSGVISRPGFGAAQDQYANKRAFERAIAFGDEAYKLFSIGPTQQYLEFHEHFGYNTVEDMWSAYLTAGDSNDGGGDLAGTFAQLHLGYLGHPGDLQSGKLSPQTPYPGETNESAIAWMTSQAGNVDVATVVCNGQYMGRRAWQPAYADTLAAASSLGWL